MNKYLQSVSNPNVFSVGDCADTGAPNLTPVLANEARIEAKNLLAEKDERPMAYPLSQVWYLRCHLLPERACWKKKPMKKD